MKKFELELDDRMLIWASFCKSFGMRSDKWNNLTENQKVRALEIMNEIVRQWAEEKMLSS